MKAEEGKMQSFTAHVTASHLYLEVKALIGEETKYLRHFIEPL